MHPPDVADIFFLLLFYEVFGWRGIVEFFEGGEALGVCLGFSYI